MQISISAIQLKLKEIFPIIGWLGKYQGNYFKFDLLAGLTLAFFVLPESMAYATLAGLPSEVGIYCCVAAGVFFALTTSSKQVAVGPTSAISLMVAASVSVLSNGDPQRYVAIASLAALSVFVISVIAYLLKLSSLVSFINENILLGFKAGAALSIMVTQLPKVFNIEAGGHNFLTRLEHLFQTLDQTNLMVLAFGAVGFILLRLGRKFLPGKPVSLLLVIATLLLFSFTDIASYGFHLAGQIPSGLPPFQRPSLKFSDVDGILGLALGIFIMGYIETVSVAKTFATKNNYAINPRQELLSLGLANFGAAFASGYPVSGGLSQSTVNDSAGAKTPLALIICSLVLVIILLGFTHLFTNLPEVLLAVIVLDAVLGLIKIKSLKELYHLSKQEFIIAMITIAAVLVFGILKGVLIAAVGSLILLIIKVKSPHVARLGKIPNTEIFTDINRNPSNQEIEGFTIIRVESSILYFNEEYVYQRILSEVSLHSCSYCILDLSSSPSLDIAGARMLIKLANELEKQDTKLRIVGGLGTVRDILRKLDIESKIGHISRADTIYQEITELQEMAKTNKG